MNLDPLEKFLYIYLLTNDKTNICGVYEIHPRIMAAETGIDKEMIVKMLARFERDGKIKTDGSWVAIGNFLKYQATSNPKVRAGILKSMELCPKHLKQWVYDRVSIPYISDSIYSNSNSNSNYNIIKENIKEKKQPSAAGNFVDFSKSTMYDPKEENKQRLLDEIKAELRQQSRPAPNPEPKLEPKPDVQLRKTQRREAKKISDNQIPFREIIDYLNTSTGAKYKHTTESSRKHIRARWNELYSIDEFKAVIDFKAQQWGKDPKMSEYLRPETLFGTKFESYLNQAKREIKKNPETQAPEQEHPEEPQRKKMTPPYNLPSLIIHSCKYCNNTYQMRWDNTQGRYQCQMCASMQDQDLPEKIRDEEAEKCNELLTAAN